jgi:hypothetical protein
MEAVAAVAPAELRDGRASAGGGRGGAGRHRPGSRDAEQRGHQAAGEEGRNDAPEPLPG